MAQARGFYDGAKIINGILPDAVEQGRIAGMAMAGDPGVKTYPGGVPLNTYTFFGQHAVSVGIHGDAIPGVEVVQARSTRDAARYLKIVLEGRPPARHLRHQRRVRSRRHVGADPAPHRSGRRAEHFCARRSAPRASLMS